MIGCKGQKFRGFEKATTRAWISASHHLWYGTLGINGEEKGLIMVW